MDAGVGDPEPGGPVVGRVLTGPVDAWGAGDPWRPGWPRGARDPRGAGEAAALGAGGAGLAGGAVRREAGAAGFGARRGGLTLDPGTQGDVGQFILETETETDW